MPITSAITATRRIMADRKQPPVGLMLLPLVALGAMLAVQYFAPPKAQTEEPAAEQAPEQAANEAPQQAAEPGEAPAQLSPIDSRSRTENQQLHQLEDDRFVASFTDLNTAMVSLQVKGERYLDREGHPFELVTTDKESYLPLAPSFSGVTVPPDARWEVVESSKERVRFQWAAPGSSPSHPTNSVPPSRSATTVPMQGQSD